MWCGFESVGLWLIRLVLDAGNVLDDLLHPQISSLFTSSLHTLFEHDVVNMSGCLGPNHGVDMMLVHVFMLS